MRSLLNGPDFETFKPNWIYLIHYLQFITRPPKHIRDKRKTLKSSWLQPKIRSDFLYPSKIVFNSKLILKHILSNLHIYNAATFARWWRCKISAHSAISVQEAVEVNWSINCNWSKRGALTYSSGSTTCFDENNWRFLENFLNKGIQYNI
jgi:hypothetical protein